MKTKGERTADRILEAACYCIAEAGIEKTSITAIAKRAKVSRALVAHHFPKKSEMFRHVVLFIAQEGYRRIEALPAAPMGFEQIDHIVSANLDFFVDNPHFFRCFFLFYYYASIRREFREMNTTMRERAISRFVQQLTFATKERGVALSAGDIMQTAERLERELISGIQSYYILTHDIPPEAYKAKIRTAVLEIVTTFLNVASSRRH